MKVKVKWLKSPLRKYGLPYGVPGGGNFIDGDFAKVLEADGFCVILSKERPVKVKDTAVRKPKTRPVKREKKD